MESNIVVMLILESCQWINGRSESESESESQYSNNVTKIDWLALHLKLEVFSNDPR